MRLANNATARAGVGDITYIPTREGWLYLAVFIDLYSRAVVGWAMASRMTASLVNDSLLMAESFFHTLKTELCHHAQYATRAQAKQAIFEYIEVFYNRKRRHSTIGYLSPFQFEEMHRKAA